MVGCSVAFGHLPRGPRCCPGGRPPGPPRVRLRACPGRWGPSPASPLGLYGWMLGGLRSPSPRAAMLSRGATPRTPTGPAEGLSGSLGTFTGLAIGALWLDARWPSVTFPAGRDVVPGGDPPDPHGSG